MSYFDIRLTNERIALDIAAFAEENGGCATVDDILPIAATPCCIIPFKEVKDADLKMLMVAIKNFMRKHSRFLNFTKDGVLEGLRLEWLPTLEDDDKVRLLAGIKLIEAVDEDGVITFNEKLYTLFTAHQKPDRDKYGSEPYSAKSSAKRSNTSKVKITSVAPVPQLAEKLAPYIEWYKRNWKYFQQEDMEGYKWTAMKHFQDTFDIDADNLADNLKEALSKEVNLLSGPMYMPKSLLIKNARYSQEEVRAALVALSDESKPIFERVDEFLAEFDRIHDANKKAGHHNERDHNMQSERAISVYLGFYHPDKHYLYKYTMWNEFASQIDFDREPLSRFPSSLYGYYQYCDQIRNVLLADKELTAMLERDRPYDNSNGHLLTQDFIYCIAYHFLGLDKNPRLYDNA